MNFISRRTGSVALPLILAALIPFIGCGTSPKLSPVQVVTASLPNGKIGTAYTTTLAATGGKAPYTWSILTGSLPAGLTLNASSGTISGTPTAATNAGITFEAQDSTKLNGSASINLLVTATVTLSVHHAEIVGQQGYSIAATTNDPAGVSWSATGSSCSGNACGSFSETSSLNGVAVTYTAPSTAGTYTIKATSAGDKQTTDSNKVAVTDLAGVTTFHMNISRTGVNSQEYALNSTNVNNTNFGKLFSCTVDGAIYAEPLWMPNLTINGTVHNVVFVATMHESIYAFDADTNTSPCTPLWHANLIDTAHGGTAGESSVPSSGAGRIVGSGYGDIAPEVGITSTPVIDPATLTLYALSKSAIVSGPTFFQRLHAIDLLTGHEKFSGPKLIAGTFPGTGDGGTTVTFDSGTQCQRPGLALSNGNIYIAWASHEDTLPYYGWVTSYNSSTLAQTGIFNLSPNVQYGGVWMDGDAPAIDTSGNLYMLNGNATFDADNATKPNNDYGDSFVTLNSALHLTQYFTPSDQAILNADDLDFGSGGAVIVDLPSSILPAGSTYPTKLVIGGGKDGTMYVLNRSSFGGFGDSNAVQKINWGYGIFSTPAFWNNTIYIAGVGGPMVAFRFDSTLGEFPTTPSFSSTATYGFPGSSPTVSSRPDNSNAVLWNLNNNLYCTPQSSGCGPTVLHAYDPNNLATEFWNSSQNAANTAGYPVKFTLPTVANGRVYIGTRGNNTGDVDTSTTIPGALEVYGLLPN